MKYNDVEEASNCYLSYKHKFYYLKDMKAVKSGKELTILIKANHYDKNIVIDAFSSKYEILQKAT